MDAEKTHWPVKVMCRVLKVSRAGYYAWKKREESQRAAEDRRLGEIIRKSHEQSRKNYGSPRIHADLRRKGERIGRKRVMRLMRAQGLHGRMRRSFKRTTDSNHDQPIAPNLLDQNFTATAPNEIWVGDVTYLRTPDGWLYLAVILDLYARMVVGWAVSASNDHRLVLAALNQAVQHRQPEAGLVHHTDRGSTYASGDYQEFLENHGFTCSMSRKGNCYDNAAMESWFSTLKAELGEDYASREAAVRALFDYIEVFYNGQRLHSTLGYLSPREFERACA